MISDPKLRDIFDKYDVSKDDSMDISELQQALESLNVKLNVNETLKILKSHDHDNSGQLSFNEFCEIFDKAKIRCVFNEIDVDQSGSINSIELSSACLKLNYKLSMNEINIILKKVDTNHDGTVNFQEFYDFFSLVPDASLNSIITKWVNDMPIDCGTDLSPPIISKDVPWYYAIFGGIAGVLSRTITAPLEKIKITAQTSIGNNKISIISELIKTYKTLGFRGMFAGNATNCIRVFPYGGIVTFIYIKGLKYLPVDNEFDTMEPIYRGSMAASAGIIGQLFTYPLDIIRARLTINPKKYNSIISCGTSIIKENNGNIKGLYKGLTPTLSAVAPFLACQMVTADMIKSQYFFNKNIEITTLNMLCIGGFAGALAQTVVYPLDVLRRRLQVQGSLLTNHQQNMNVLSDNTWLAMRQVVQKEGVRTLFNGIGVTYLKVLPACAIGMTTTKELIAFSKKYES